VAILFPAGGFRLRLGWSVGVKHPSGCHHRGGDALMVGDVSALLSIVGWQIFLDGPAAGPAMAGAEIVSVIPHSSFSEERVS
jgi:hypothetical protein